MIEAVTARARLWQADAQVVEIEYAHQDNWRYVGPEVELRFYSPAEGTGFQVSVTTEGVSTHAFDRAVSWGREALPMTFVDLPSALHVARQHDFAGPLKRADLRTWSPAGSAPLLAWRLSNERGGRTVDAANGDLITFDVSGYKAAYNMQWQRAAEGLRQLFGGDAASRVSDYNKGVAAYLAGDFDTALQWYLAAAQQGHANAQYNLGNMYREGEGTRRDAKRAVEWLRKAADQGLAGAQNNLGVMYNKGDGVDRDAVQAVHWFEKSAIQGNAAAQINLGLAHYRGSGTQQSDELAFAWFRKAARQGEARAQDYLGLMWLDGRGVRPDPGEAARWIRRAADQGDPQAQYHLAQLYRKGRGVTQDDEAWRFWEGKAREQGLIHSGLEVGGSAIWQGDRAGQR